MSGFNSRLAALRRLWQAGLLLRASVRCAALALSLLAACGALDYLFAFEDSVRLGAGFALLGVLASFAAISAAKIFKLGDRDMALRADDLLEAPDRQMLSALELSEWQRKAPDGFSSFLAGVGVEDAGKALSKLSLLKALPLPELGRSLRSLLLLAAALAAFAFLAPETAETLAGRLLKPLEDIPPCSAFRFSVAPAEPKILYGGDQSLTAEISGAPVKSQVWLMTRYEGKVYKAACFQEGGARYAQKLEKVTLPLEFCFAVGKARSKWHKVDLVCQPVIAVASLKIVSPAYSGLRPKSFFAGNDELAGLKGSKVELSVTSNRELQDGKLLLKPKGQGQEEFVKGVKTGPKTLAFSWELKGPAEVEAIIRDLRGTVNKDPYVLSQKLLPDKPPELCLSQPSEFSLATPGSSIPVSGYADDDLWLQRAALVRTLVGYRDRVKPLGPDAPTRHLDFQCSLDLKGLGVEPGQTLEFYAEAADGNPELTGLSSSSIARVQIISEEDYALMLRVRAGIEDFSARYSLVAAQLEEARKALKELLDEASSAKRDEGRLGELLEKARDAMRKTASLYQEMADDFQLYDLEKEFFPVLHGAADKFKDYQRRLEKSSADEPALAAKLEDLRKEFASEASEVEQGVADAAEVEALAKLMECKIRFERIAADQETLVRRLQRLESETRFSDLKLLSTLGARQEELRLELQSVAEDIAKRSEALPPGYEKLQDASLTFAAKIEKLEIPGLMRKASSSAANGDGRRALGSSEAALEGMRSLLVESESSPFSCDSKGNPGFDAKGKAKSTLRQMLEALKCAGRGGRNPGRGLGAAGSGKGSGEGGVYGGSLDDGYRSGMSSPLNTPVFGPRRSEFGKTGGAGPGPAGAKIGKGASERMAQPPPSKAPGASKSSTPESVPDKYREAVKKYFSGQQEERR